MPELLQEQFTTYENEYAKIKRGRKLVWMDHLGTVELEIELEDRNLVVEASPLQACILYAFEEQGSHTLVMGADGRGTLCGGVVSDDGDGGCCCETSDVVLGCSGGCEGSCAGYLSCLGTC
jgi:hypothetical protein